MIEKMERMPDAPRIDRGTPVRIRAGSEALTRDFLPLDGTKTYLVCWRTVPDRTLVPDAQPTLLLSEPVDGATEVALMKATSEIDVQNILFAARRVSCYVPEPDVVFAPQRLNS